MFIINLCDLCIFNAHCCRLIGILSELPKSDFGRFGWHQRREAGDSSDGLCDFALREWGGCERRRGAAERPSDSDLVRSHEALGRQACDTAEMGGTEESARRRGKTWIAEMPETETSWHILTFFFSLFFLNMLNRWTVEPLDVRYVQNSGRPL